MIFNRLLLSLFICTLTFGATTISGYTLDEKNSPVPYVNIYLENTFDGSDSDEQGYFVFESDEVGEKVLLVTMIGYEDQRDTLYLDNQDISLNLVLVQKISQADEVVISAGSFGASDDDKVIVLDPIDIVTVASSRGEITGALEALPGTQPQSDEQGIYVRGGDASEAKQIVDGLLIQNPYFSDVPDIPQRGRFEPFDFQGTAFSQGGYSAQYGQALSAVVDLKTWTRFGEFNANTFGVTPLSLSYGRAYGNDSTVCGINVDYTNISLFQDFNNKSFLSEYIQNRTNFSKPPEGIEIKANYAKKLNNGVYKFLAKYTDYKLGTTEAEIGSSFNLNNNNNFLLTTYKGLLNDEWKIDLGLSYSDNTNDANIIFNFGDDGVVEAPININSYDDLLQFRTVLTKKIFSRSKVKFGFHIFDQTSEFMNYNFIEDNEAESNQINIDEYLSTAFTEIDLRLSRKFALNSGLRYEKSYLLDKSSISPRFSMAYKTGKYSQISYAFGEYFQTPDIGFDQWYRQNNIDYREFNIADLEFEQSTHHILNYEWNKDDITLRLEAFNKEYDDLIIIPENPMDDIIYSPNILSNSGDGYSRGFEMFWRNDQSRDGEGKDIWVAYSYLDSKRTFKHYYPEKIIPSFASNHKLTFIYKETFTLKNEDRFNASLAMTATTGFPYYDPYDEKQFESKPYLSFDVGGSYLPKVEDGFMVIFFNISNPFGYRNSFGYNYTGYDNAALIEPEEKLPSSLRSIFIGCFMFFSVDKD